MQKRNIFQFLKFCICAMVKNCDHFWYFQAMFKCLLQIFKWSTLATNLFSRIGFFKLGNFAHIYNKRTTQEVKEAISMIGFVFKSRIKGEYNNVLFIYTIQAEDDTNLNSIYDGKCIFSAYWVRQVKYWTSKQQSLSQNSFYSF